MRAYVSVTDFTDLSKKSLIVLRMRAVTIGILIGRDNSVSADLMVMYAF